MMLWHRYIFNSLNTLNTLFPNSYPAFLAVYTIHSKNWEESSNYFCPHIKWKWGPGVLNHISYCDVVRRIRSRALNSARNAPDLPFVVWPCQTMGAILSCHYAHNRLALVSVLSIWPPIWLVYSFVPIKSWLLHTMPRLAIYRSLQLKLLVILW